MTDLQILLIVVGCIVAFAGYLAAVRPGAADERARAPRRRWPPRSCFVYLLWALLRPEDF